VVSVPLTLSPAVSDQLTRTEIGYAGSTGLLALMLWMLYRRGSRPLSRSGVAEEIATGTSRDRPARPDAQSAPPARATASTPHPTTP
jgi:hypothetical protein